MVGCLLGDKQVVPQESVPKELGSTKQDWQRLQSLTNQLQKDKESLQKVIHNLETRIGVEPVASSPSSPIRGALGVIKAGNILSPLPARSPRSPRKSPSRKPMVQSRGKLPMSLDGDALLSGPALHSLVRRGGAWLEITMHPSTTSFKTQNFVPHLSLALGIENTRIQLESRKRSIRRESTWTRSPPSPQPWILRTSRRLQQRAQIWPSSWNVRLPRALHGQAFAPLRVRAPQAHCLRTA